MNWTDPEARLALIDRVGAVEYSRRMDEYLKGLEMGQENGYVLRKVEATRFGDLIEVADTGAAFATEAQARAHARSLPTKR